MNIYVRPRSSYNPKTPDRDLPFVRVVNFAGTRIGHIKEELKRVAVGARLDELFLFNGRDGRMYRLEDGRTVAHYNLEDSDILETTSNPFFAAAMYVLLCDAEKKQAVAENRRFYETMERSKIHKCTILQVLFNSDKEVAGVQPDPFPDVDSFMTFVRDHKKKGMEASPFTEAALYKFYTEFMNIDMHTADPLRSFVNRYAVSLKFRNPDGTDNTANPLLPDHLQPNPAIPAVPPPPRGRGRAAPRARAAPAGRGRAIGPPANNNLGVGHRLGGIEAAVGLYGNNYNNPRGPDAVGYNPRARRAGAVGLAAVDRQPARGAGGLAAVNPAPGIVGAQGLQAGAVAGGRRKRKSVRTCENCTFGVEATVYCAQCEGGIVLCDHCDEFTHQGAARRAHQRTGVEEAPKQSRAYTPQAYMAPFAVVLGLFYGHLSVPMQLSMTSEELRSAAQNVTDTDLSSKTKRIGGFDGAMEPLLTKKIIKREASETPTYALEDKALVEFLQTAQIPALPHTLGSDNYLVGTRRLCLLIDTREKNTVRLMDMVRGLGITCQKRDLPAGDYMWVLLPPGAREEYNSVLPAMETVLPVVVERKSWDDLNASVRDGRFERQINKLKGCGFRDKFYLVEGSMADMRNAKVDNDLKAHLKNCLQDVMIQDEFHVTHTGSWMKTAHWLSWMTYILAEAVRAERTTGVTFAEFCERARGNPAPQAPPPGRTHTGIVWSAEDFINQLWSSTDHRTVLTSVTQALGVARPHDPNTRTLLVLQGLEAYNKTRFKCLNDCLAIICNDTNREAAEVVETNLYNQRRKLVHYDVHIYFKTLLQVRLGVEVTRTETPEETETILAAFQTASGAFAQNPNNLERHERNIPLPIDVPDQGPDPVLVIGEQAGTLSRADCAENSQDEEKMLQEALKQSAEATQIRSPAAQMSEENLHLAEVLQRSLLDEVNKPKATATVTSAVVSNTPIELGSDSDDEADDIGRESPDLFDNDSHNMDIHDALDNGVYEDEIPDLTLEDSQPKGMENVAETNIKQEIMDDTSNSDDQQLQKVLDQSIKEYQEEQAIFQPKAMEIVAEKNIKQEIMDDTSNSDDQQLQKALDQSMKDYQEELANKDIQDVLRHSVQEGQASGQIKLEPQDDDLKLTLERSLHDIEATVLDHTQHDLMKSAKSMTDNLSVFPTKKNLPTAHITPMNSQETVEENDIGIQLDDELIKEQQKLYAEITKSASKSIKEASPPSKEYHKQVKVKLEPDEMPNIGMSLDDNFLKQQESILNNYTQTKDSTKRKLLESPISKGGGYDKASFEAVPIKIEPDIDTLPDLGVEIDQKFVKEQQAMLDALKKMKESPMKAQEGIDRGGATSPGIPPEKKARNDIELVSQLDDYRELQRMRYSQQRTPTSSSATSSRRPSATFVPSQHSQSQVHTLGSSTHGQDRVSETVGVRDVFGGIGSQAVGAGDRLGTGGLGFVGRRPALIAQPVAPDVRDRVPATVGRDAFGGIGSSSFGSGDRFGSGGMSFASQRPTQPVAPDRIASVTPNRRPFGSSSSASASTSGIKQESLSDNDDKDYSDTQKKEEEKGVHCGACGGFGHSRAQRVCPEFTSAAEQARRQGIAQRAQQKKDADKQAKADTVRQLTEQRNLLRNSLHTLENQIDNIDTLVNRVQGNNRRPARGGGRGRGRGRGRGQAQQGGQ